MRFNVKVLTYFGRIVFFILFFLAHYFVLKNIVLLSKDLLYGDLSGEKIFPAPQYGFFRIPNTSLVKHNNAHDKLAGDFAQVYFPSKKFNELSDNYIYGKFDPWGRSSRYAPFVHYLCAISYCRLDYGLASLVHIYIQLFLFYIVFAFAFFILNIARHLPLGILLVNVGLFLTPAGLSWFERGQFSLYVGISYLFIVLGMLKRKPFFFLLGALFAFIKWTSLPAIFVMLSVFIFTSGNFKELKVKVLLTVPFFVAMLVLLSSFPREGYYFLQGLYLQELFETPEGVSLVKLLPVEYMKFLPFALIGFGMLHVYKFRGKLDEYLPFYTGVCILMLTYPTVAYEYNMPSLFFFIPFVVYWAGFPGSPGGALVRGIMKYTFFIFLLFSSYFNILADFFHMEFAVLFLYLLIAMIYLITPLVLSRSPLQDEKHAWLGNTQ